MAMAKLKGGDDPLMDSVTCLLCKEVLDDPRSLPCMHSYCKNCIQKVMDKHRNKKEFPCPKCKEPCPVPEQGAAGLRVNFFAHSVLNAVKERSVSSTEEALTNFNICRQPQAHALVLSTCEECNQKMCKACGCEHQLVGSTESHTTESGGHSENSNLSRQKMYCKTHNKLLKYFCLIDRCLICEDCIDLSHKRHTLKDIEQSAKVHLKSTIDLGKQKSATYASGITSYHNSKKAIEEQEAATKAKLAEERKKEHDKIDAHFDRLEAEALAAASVSIIDTLARIDKLQLEKDKIDDTVKLLEVIQEHGNETDIMCMVPQMHDKRKSWSVPTDFDSEDQIGLRLLLDDSMLDEDNTHVLVEHLEEIAVLQNDDIIKIGDGDAIIYDKNLIQKESFTFPEITGSCHKTKDDICVIMLPSRFEFYDIKNGKHFKSVYNVIQNATDFVINHNSEILILAFDRKIIRSSETGKVLNQYDLGGTSGREGMKGDATMSVNSKNDIIMSYHGGVLGIRVIKDTLQRIFEYIPHKDTGYNMYAHVDNKDNIITVNKNKNTIEVLTPNGVYIKDLLAPKSTDCEIIRVESNSKGELVVGAIHKGSWEKCMFTLQYRGQDGSIL